jgi:hypothetical protein
VLPALTLALLVYSNGGEEVAVSVRQQLAAALRAQGAAIVDRAVDTAIEEHRAGWRSKDSLAFFAEIRALVERGRRARERVELEEATRLFAEAEALCARHATEPAIGAVLGEAALEHGVALAELRRTDEARAAFTRALSFAPSLTLTEKSARPDVVRLFREIARAPRTPPQQPPKKDLVSDVTEERLSSLRQGPNGGAMSALVESLGADAAIFVVASSDGKRMLASRAEAGCATAAIELDASKLELGVEQLLHAPCESGAPQLRVDDARLQAAPVAVVAAQAPKPAKKAAKWPWIFAGAMGITAAVIGVTVGVIASDPRYQLKVDGRSFGAP